jgi:predicted secreted Zn-dependent protease
MLKMDKIDIKNLLRRHNGKNFDKEMSSLREKMIVCIIFYGIFILPTTLYAQVEFNIKTNHYLISGSTYKEFIDSIVSNRPWKTNLNFLAYTKWWVEWVADVEYVDGLYKPGRVKVLVKSDIIMPAYKPPTNGVSSEFLRQWALFYKNLLDHEIGHVNIAKKAGEDVYSTVMKLPPMASRRELLLLIDQTAKKVVDKYRDKEIEYDKKTQHGLKQIKGQ